MMFLKVEQYTVNSGYQAHAPITLSGKKYALDKVYALNKQVSKYVVMAFFSDNTSILSFVVTGYGCMLTMHVLRAFSVTRPLNARLRKARPVLHGAEKPRTRQ